MRTHHGAGGPGAAGPSAARPSAAEPSAAGPSADGAQPGRRSRPGIAAGLRLSRDPERRRQLGAAFSEAAGIEEARAYDAVRPGYPQPVVDRIVDAGGRAPVVVELGAGTGILTRPMLRRGAEVHAVEPSAAMRQVMAERTEGPEAPGRLHIHHTTAESTGLAEDTADLVVAAQAWHWFDDAAVIAEARRVLRAGGALAVVGNFLDTSHPWVHRLTRITRAGDIYVPGQQPRLAGESFLPWQTEEHWWDRPITPEGIRRLSRTLSSWLRAGQQDRARRGANLDWYLDEHLGLVAGEPVDLPYITVLHTTQPNPRFTLGN